MSTHNDKGTAKEKSRLIFMLYVTLLFNFYSLDIICLATRNDQSTQYFGKEMSRLQRHLSYAFLNEFLRNFHFLIRIIPRLY